MRDVIGLERELTAEKKAKIRDIIKRVATGTTTVEDARELERVFEKVYGIWYNLTVHERS